MTKLLYTFLFILIFSLFSVGQKQAVNPEKIDLENIIENAKNGGAVLLPEQDESFFAGKSDLIDSETQTMFPGLKSYDLYNRWGEMVGNLTTADGRIYYNIDNEDGNVTSFYPNHKTGEYVLEETTERYWTCATEEIKGQLSSSPRSDIGKYSYGDDLQSFRLAVIATGEFYEQHGNTDILVMADIVKTLSGVNRIFERDLSLNFTLSGRVKLYADKTTDPFTPGANRTILSAGAFANDFDIAAYDLGITFNSNAAGWPGGGVAVIEAACSLGMPLSGPTKARIWASSAGEADNGFTALVTHELGHAFGARHTMNSDAELCEDAISSNNSYEIGSGNTIMAYGGKCGEGDDYVLPDETINNYFHFASLYAMAQYTKSLSCQDVFTTLNTPPDINMNPCNMAAFQVPLSTPFSINAEGSDSESTNLTYVWEQFDEDGQGTPNSGFLGPQASISSKGPLFRGYAPSANTRRDFPRFFNYFFEDPFETLSKVARDITLRCTVRDNDTEGGIFTSDELIVEVMDVGPLIIEIDSLLDTIVGGETINLMWNDDGISGLCERLDVNLISLSDPSIVIPVASDIAYTELGLEYLVAPGFSIDGDFHFKVECHVSDCFSFYSYSRPFFSKTNSCPTQESYFACGLDDVTANIGEEVLNQSGVQTFAGIQTFSEEFLLDSNDPQAPFFRMSLADVCETLVFDSGNPLRRNFEYITFRVAESGTFRISNQTTPVAGLAVFDDDIFDSEDPCASLIGTNLSESVNTPGTLTTTFVERMDVELEGCKTYRLGITKAENEDLTFSISLSGSSALSVEEGVQIDASFLYVVENENGVIEAILSNPDFRELRQGLKNVYTIKVDPETFVASDFIGKLLIDLGIEGVCVGRSSNTTEMLLINPLPDDDMDGYHTDEDCDDTDANVNPGAMEIINNTIDENCDGIIEAVDADEDGFNAGFDCDDNDPLINPDAEEIVNNDVDENCDGEVTIIDEDMDGFNSDVDCDDSNAAANPGAEEIPNNDVDENCDGEILIIDADMDGFNSDDDCDDADASANPGAEEIPNNDVDENCDGEILFIDEDMDGFNSSVDCDDNDPLINPDAEEIPSNSVDEDCDGIVLNFDADMDGFNSEDDCDDADPNVNPNAEEIANNDIDENCDGEFLMIDEDMDGFNSAVDCDDTNAAINPDAEEIPNNEVDENCDGAVVIIDNDMDGFNSDDDCNDEDALVNPDAEEIPNNDVDENCDGVANVVDEDMDGFNSDDDCNDMDAAVNPDAVEIPNNDIDENCNGELGYIDEDMDGYTGLVDCNDLDSLINPGATEIANNGIDENCDGEDLTSSTGNVALATLKIYPNPVKDELVVDMGDTPRSFTLQNIQGQVVYRSAQFQGESSFFLGDIPSGMYLMTVYDIENELISSGKLIKI